MEFILNKILPAIETYAWSIIVGGLFLFSLEFFLPMSKDSFRSRVRGILVWFIYIPITVSFYTIFNQFLVKLNITPLINLNFKVITESDNNLLRFFGYLIVPYIIFAISDFFYYWFHRLQHTSKLMWRFHQVHHALEEMNAFNSYHHWAEEILRIPFIVIPLSLLFHFDQGYIPVIIFTLLSFHGIFLHSNTKLNLSIFRYVVADNMFHRLHHSVQKEHWNKNYGSFTSFWDVIFKTAVFPSGSEWPKVGLSYLKEETSFKNYMTVPFKSMAEIKKKNQEKTAGLFKNLF